MKKLIAIFITSSLFATGASAATKLVCVSWMDLKVEIMEMALSESETGTLIFDQNDWSYSADVFEGRMNHLQVTYKPLKLSTTSRSLQWPLDQLSHYLEIDGKQATVDCDLR